MGPFINLSLISFLSNLIAISKHEEIYLFDFDEILLNARDCLRSISIKFIFFNLSLFLMISYSFIKLNLIFFFKILDCL